LHLRLSEITRTNSSFAPSRWGGEPHVIVDAGAAWPALRRWQPEYLKSVAGHSEVTVREMVGAPRNVFRNLREGGSLPFADYVDWVTETAAELVPIVGVARSAADIMRAVDGSGMEQSYYLDLPLADLSPQLRAEVDPPHWYGVPPYDAMLWLGVIGSSSGTHFDLLPNCNVQVAGTKQFILFDPSQASRLYPSPGREAGCELDPNLPDYDRFPRARGLRGYVCELRAGEAIYIPAGWYHQVTVTSPWALNVNFWWPRPRRQTWATASLRRVVLRRRWATLRERLGRFNRGTGR
jgi:hypothetical protein